MRNGPDYPILLPARLGAAAAIAPTIAPSWALASHRLQQTKCHNRGNYVEDGSDYKNCRPLPVQVVNRLPPPEKWPRDAIEHAID
jgi:hypothetical protein